MQPSYLCHGLQTLSSAVKLVFWSPLRQAPRSFSEFILGSNEGKKWCSWGFPEPYGRPGESTLSALWCHRHQSLSRFSLLLQEASFTHFSVRPPSFTLLLRSCYFAFPWNGVPDEKSPPEADMCVCMCVCIRVCECVSMCLRLYACVSACVYMCVRACACECVYA